MSTHGTLAYTDAKWGKTAAESASRTGAFEGSGNGNGSGNGDYVDWLSEERNEVFSSKAKTQVKLDPLQVCLFPTYLGLSEPVLQQDLRVNLQELVNSKLRQDYGEDFVYFAFTDAKIDWYSGEESVPVCGTLQQRLPGVDGLRSQTSRGGEAKPCTCALYSGATVMLKYDKSSPDENLATPEILEPKISEVLTEELVITLQDVPSPRDETFYTELKGASVSWSAAQRQGGGKLVYFVPDPDQTEHLLAPEIPVIAEPETAILDQDLEDSTVLDVVIISAVQESESHESPKANAFSTQQGKILASVVGAILLLALVALFFVLCRKKKRRREQASSSDKGKNDTSTVISNEDGIGDRDDADVEIARGGRRKKRHVRSNSASSAEEADTDFDDQSEAAQYKSSGNILDCISVGSEWTLTTGVTDGVSSALGLGSSGNKTRAEMIAAKETFDRDRQITLQKDMLQSEWSSAVCSPSGLPLTRAGSRSISRSSSKNKKKKNKDINAVQFEEATGQGEEIFLMEPAR